MSPPPIYRGGAAGFSLEILWVVWVQRSWYDPCPCPATVVPPAARSEALNVCCRELITCTLETRAPGLGHRAP
ncbi:hypothetical protein ACLOJK_037001, partial [Asimina triloba]